jgi:hypothetical protein
MDMMFHGKPSEGLSFVRTGIMARQKKVPLYCTEDPTHLTTLPAYGFMF